MKKLDIEEIHEQHAMLFSGKNILISNSASHVHDALRQFQYLDLVVTWNTKLADHFSDTDLIFIPYDYFVEHYQVFTPQILYLSYIVSNLDSEQDVQSLLQICVEITTGSLIIRDNYYDSDSNFHKIGFKTFASNLDSNKVRLKAHDYLDIVGSLDILSLSIFGVGFISSLEDTYVLPLDTPKNFWYHQNQELANKIQSEKPRDAVNFLAYRFIHVVCNLGCYTKPSFILNNAHLITFHRFKSAGERLVTLVRRTPHLEISSYLRDTEQLKSNDIDITIVDSSYHFSSARQTNLDSKTLSRATFSSSFQIPDVYLAEIRNCLVCPPSFGLLTANKRAISESLYLSDQERLERHILGGGLSLDTPYSTLGAYSVPERAYYLLANAGFANYYHWNIQCLAAATLLENLPSEADICLLLPPLKPWQQRSLELAGFSNYPTQTIETNLQEVKKLFYPSLLSGQYVYRPWRGIIQLFQKIKKAVFAKMPYGETQDSMLYVTRFDSPRRRVLNEQDLANRLSELGFSIITPGSLSLEEQIQTFSQAKVIIAPHGAGLTNLVYCNPGTVLYELFPRNYQNPCFFRLAQLFELDYWTDSFDIDGSADASTSHHYTNWSVNIDQVLDKTDTILKTLNTYDSVI